MSRLLRAVWVGACLACVLFPCGGCAATASDPEAPGQDGRSSAGDGSADENGSAGEMGRVDAKLLAISTLIRSRTARVILSSYWRNRVKLAGIRTDKDEPDKWIAHGSAKFELDKLRIEATSEITVTFLDDTEDLVVFAKDVQLYKRTKNHIVDRQENVHMVSIANGKVTVFSQGGAGR